MWTRPINAMPGCTPMTLMIEIKLYILCENTFCYLRRSETIDRETMPKGEDDHHPNNIDYRLQNTAAVDRLRKQTTNRLDRLGVVASISNSLSK